VSRFQPGEIVEIRIPRAKVIKAANLTEDNPGPDAPASDLYVEIDEALDLRIALPLSQIRVSRVAPKEWPPQPGDLWATADDTRWLACAGDDDYVYLTGRLGGIEPDVALEAYGPLRLLYREGSASGAVPVVDERKRLSEQEHRAEYIAGLREAADYFETHPQVPAPPTSQLLHVLGYGFDDESAIAEIERVAALFGSDIEAPSPENPGKHLGAVLNFRGDVSYRVAHIPSKAYRDALRAEGERLAEAAAKAELGHAHVAGATGGEGDNDAECACGAVFYGFDTHAEAVAALDQHIANPKPAEASA
jgi:hypothetical protein